MGDMRDFMAKRRDEKLRAATAPFAPVVPPSTPSYCCGHAIDLAKLARLPCTTCRVNGKVPDDSERLPDCSSYHVTYDAARHIWFGRLDTPDGTISGESNAVHKLLVELGERYRENAAKGDQCINQ